MTTETPTQACYWIIGIDNQGQAPAVAVDLHAADGALANEGRGTWTRELPRTHPRTAARALAIAYAATHGVPQNQVSYDSDSTDCYKTA